MKKRITSTSVDALMPGQTIFDDAVRGFFCRYRGKGRHYALKFSFQNRQRVVTIGEHGSPWTPDSARKRAKELQGQVAKGVDPATARDHANGLPTVSAALDRFLDEHVDGLRKPSTYRQYSGAARLHIKPSLGRVRVDALSPADISKLHNDLKATPHLANRCLAILSKFCNWLERQNLRPRNSNPVKGADRFPETRRERFLSSDELARLGDALLAAEVTGENKHALALFRLLILTGARVGEIQTLKWEHVDIQRSLLLLPDSKTGAKAIVLNAPALAVIADIDQIEGNPYVICGEREASHFVGVAKVWARIRTAAKLDRVRIHDLRHSFASVAAARGGSLIMIGKLLGHSQQSTTARYAHLAADPMKELADAAGATISTAMARNSIPAPSAEIIALDKTKNAV